MDTLNHLTLDVRGTIVEVNPDSPGDFVRVVYQRTGNQFANYHTGTGAPRQRRAYVATPNPKTSAQLHQQAKLRAAVAAWHTADTATRETARPVAVARAITLYMAFVSNFMASYEPPLGTQWDAGATTWDSGLTTWDV